MNTGAFLSKFSDSGDFQWSRVWGESGDTDSVDCPYAVCVDWENNIYVTGMSDRQTFLRSYDINGEFRFEKILDWTDFS